MTKREKESFVRKLKAMEQKLSKKRDEVRALVSDIEELVSTAERGAEELDWAVSHLRDAVRAVEDAGDAMSEQV